MEAQTSGRIPPLAGWFGVLTLTLVMNVNAQVAGPNHNAVAGPVDPDEPDAFLRTDLFRQRENEPVVSVSSIHPEHLLVAANDYRPIDVAADFGLGEADGTVLSTVVELLQQAGRWLARTLGWSSGELQSAPVASHPEAWMGIYRSCDRGRTWISGLVPGSPHDLSPASLASPLRGVDAASDPFMAAGRDGRVYLGGMAFTRTGFSKIFLARYTDRMDREGGACFDYDFTRVLEKGSASSIGKFADKPTIAADPFGRVYVAYTLFTGLEKGGKFRSRIRFLRSTDEGVTWSAPQNISKSAGHAQGAGFAIDPRSGALYVAWRDFVDNQIMMVKSTNFGASFSAPKAVHPGTIAAFDQPAVVTSPPCPANDSGCQFRSLGFPTIAVVDTGSARKVLVAWQERVSGTPRIVLTMSADGGVNWTPRRAVDTGLRMEADPSTGGEPTTRPAGPQVMPALSCSAGHCMLTYYEARNSLAGGASFLSGIERQMDLRVVELNLADGSPLRPSAQVSQYPLETGSHPPRIAEAAPGLERVHRPNLPLFVGGKVASTGDYNGLAPVLPHSREGGIWRWSTPADVPLPTFFGVWTSNENVEFPDGDIRGDWTSYTAPGSGAPSCSNPGSRDQDVFLSEIGLDGIVASSPSLFKPLLEPDGAPIPRTFVVTLENRTGLSRRVKLELSPRDAFTTMTFDRQDLGFTVIQDLEILPFSSTTQTVVLFSTLREGSARVDVRDAGNPGLPLLSRVLLNAYPVAFPLTNTDIADSEVHTPKISNLTFVQVVDTGSPRFSNRMPSSPRFSNPRFSNLALPETSIEEVDATFTVINAGNTISAYDLVVNFAGGEDLLATGKFAFQLLIYRTVTEPGSDADCQPIEILSDTLVSSIADPRFSNPRFSNREAENPRFSNPRFSNPRFSNATFSVAPAEGVLSEASPDGTLQSKLSVPALAGHPELPPELEGERPDQIYCTLRVFRTAPASPGDPEVPDLKTFVEDNTGIAVVAEAPDFENGNFTERAFDFAGETPPVPPFVVTNTNDSGNGSLRQVLLDANTATGVDVITFQIGGAGSHTIAPASELPTVTEPVVIDGTTQPGYAGTPVVELTGLSAVARGLRIVSGESTVRGLAINSFTVAGIELVAFGGGNVIQGNFIGTDVTGTLALPNGTGILMSDSPNNDIGGATASAGNLISGNGQYGILVQGVLSSGNDILGNRIGTSGDGTSRLPNGNGVVVFSPSNTIGGATAFARNVISGNDGIGVWFGDPLAPGNVLQGNYIGTNASGTAALGNLSHGVLVSAPNNVVGGTLAGSGNVISGNSNGVVISGADATGNLVQGNFIGTDAAGTAAVPNFGGLLLFSGAQGNTIGGTSIGARNVISGNTQSGVRIGAGATLNQVQGNFIGTNQDGTAALANGFRGVVIDGSPGNVIGGAVPGAGNVISGNALGGVEISGATATGNAVRRNFIGTDASGTIALGNGTGAGVQIGAPSNTIGASTDTRNVISGNATWGVVLLGPDATSNVIAANLIGTDASGNTAVPNGHGILVLSAGPNTIGSDFPGLGNLVSGNTGEGVWLTGVGAAGNVVLGNLIGTNSAGTSALGNGGNGVLIDANAFNNSVGGSPASTRNVISGNGLNGVRIDGNGNIVRGNYIGTDVTGTGALGNTLAGVFIASGTGFNAVGGTPFGTEPNRIAFNGQEGILLGPGAGSGNVLRFNELDSNGGLGIDLGSDGVTLNDAGDGDTGPNDRQNFPVLTSVTSGGTTTVHGSLNSTATTFFTIDFFSSPTCDPSGNGEGLAWLAKVDQSTDVSGNLTFDTVIPTPLAGTFVTAIATAPNLSTSELSNCVVVP